MIRGTRRPSPPWSWVPMALLIACVAASGAATGFDGRSGAARASAPDETLSGAAVPLLPAQRLSMQDVVGGLDAVSVYNRATALLPAVQDAAAAAANQTGARWALGRGATVGLRAVTRDGVMAASAPDGAQFPIAVTSLPADAVAALMNAEVAATIARGQVVFGARSADLEHVRAGDVVEVIGLDGATRSVSVGMIAPDEVVGGSEVVAPIGVAETLGIDVDTRIVIWGITSRAALDAAFDAEGLTRRADTRIRRSWAGADPDSTLGLGATKQLLGEFSYRVSPAGAVQLDAAWVGAFLPAAREVLVASIPVRARCNVRIRADLAAALDDVARAGLAGAIDIADTNAYGGCFNPRFNRLGAAVGTLSRHAWGAAIDMNTRANAQGAPPQMNCDVVRIFRRHNFAWGGNFLTPDGMHFEWVGTRRDLLPYTSTYCPNLPGPSGGESTDPVRTADVSSPTSPPGATTRTELFVEETSSAE